MIFADVEKIYRINKTINLKGIINQRSAKDYGGYLFCN